MNNFLQKLKDAPQSISFEDTMSTIEQNYNFSAAEFKNGELLNAENENNGSCKIFAFALINNLTEQQTLHCFGDYYRKDVLDNPTNNDHQNIRNFMKTGWAGIAFNSEPLTEK